MAQIDAMKNNVGFPIYGLLYTVVVPILDADGDPVTTGTISSTVSTNGDTAAAGAVPVQIPTNTGAFYLTLTSAEMLGNIIEYSVTSDAVGAKKTIGVIYPEILPILLTSNNAGAFDSATTINLGVNASSINNYYNGCVVHIYAGTGAVQVRMITGYNGTTKIATVHVAWATNPDATSDLMVHRTSLAPYVNGANIELIGGVDVNTIELDVINAPIAITD